MLAPMTTAPSPPDHSPITLVWFRDDLRIQDNPALADAAAHGAVVALFVEEENTGIRPIGAAARWWRNRSLEALRADLAAHGVEMLYAHGDPRTVVPDIAQQIAAGAKGTVRVSWNRRYHEPMRVTDAGVKTCLAERGIEAHSFPGYLLTEPWRVQTGSGTPYRVFTPFAKSAQQSLLDDPPQPREVPELRGAKLALAHPSLIDAAQLGCGTAQPAWIAQLAEHNAPGETAAHERLQAFLDGLARGESYKADHDVPSADATSGLSPHLRFGEISPGYVWAETARLAEAHPAAAPDAWAFLRQLLWRDFAWHRLYHLPRLTTNNVREQFDDFPWEWSGKVAPGASISAFVREEDDPDAQHLAQLAAWQRGRTGIPLIDAGMRQLWTTGTMHNRVRMVVGSWLTKNLGIHWRHGEEWFWDTLVDADYASNPFNWQWVAGCGDDAAPYFRVFNPLTQEKKFDPHGLYVAQWVPERHTPNYPEPMVDVKESRKVALAAYDDIRR